MSRVKLVFVKSYMEMPTFADTFHRDVEIESPGDIDNFHLIAARIYAPDDGSHPHEDPTSVILDYRDTGDLLGKLLTYIDATFTDQEQRKAHKDIVRQLVNDWRENLRQRAYQTIASQEAAEPVKG